VTCIGLPACPKNEACVWPDVLKSDTRDCGAANEVAERCSEVPRDDRRTVRASEEDMSRLRDPNPVAEWVRKSDPPDADELTTRFRSPRGLLSQALGSGVVRPPYTTAPEASTRGGK
jgi:hypothetical protein